VQEIIAVPFGSIKCQAKAFQLGVHCLIAIQERDCYFCVVAFTWLSYISMVVPWHAPSYCAKKSGILARPDDSPIQSQTSSTLSHASRAQSARDCDPHLITVSRSFSVTLFTSPNRFSLFAAGSALEPCSKPAVWRIAAFSLAPTPQKRSYAKKKMPPKKAVKEEKILLGRPGNSLKSCIVCRERPPRERDG